MNREQVSAQQQLFYGQPDVPSTTDLERAWKAVKTIASAAGPLTELERRCLLGRMSAMGASAAVVEHVMAFDPRSESLGAVVGGIRASARNRWLTPAWMVYEGLSVAMSDGDLEPGELDAVRRAAASLDLPPDTVEALVQVCDDEAMIRRRRIDLLFSEEAPILHYDEL